MRVFLNATLTDKPFGGANSFLRTLVKALATRGVETVYDINGRFDVALINALTNGVGSGDLERLRSRGVPIVHRKVGYRRSGSLEMRREANGVIEGDRRQIVFDPYCDASIFQSRYSLEAFLAEGYAGQHWQVIPNGVDPAIFSITEPARFFWQEPRQRSFWDGKSVFRFAISTWSADRTKGFDHYVEFDRILPELPGVEIDLVGRVPPDVSFKNIRVHSPKRAPALARFLRRHHGYLAFSEYDTCSNALIEAISCGLQVIFLDSGGHRELTAHDGLPYAGDFRAQVRELIAGYEERRRVMNAGRFEIDKVAVRYAAILEDAARGRFRGAD